MNVYRIGVSGEVAQTAAATRRRHVTTAQGPILLEFGKVPVFLTFLPPEVERDPHLVVTPMSEETMKQLGGKPKLLSPSDSPVRPKRERR